MKHHNFRLTVLALTVLGLLATTASSLAEATNTVHLKVVTFNQVLFDDNFAVSPCLNSNEGGELTTNAWCAIDQLALSKSWTASSTWSSFGVMLNSINEYNGADGNYWLWYNNNEPGATALNQHILTDNENILLTYGISPLKITASTSTPEVDSTSTLNVAYFDVMAWTWQPVADCDLIINGATIANSGSNYDLLVSTTTPYVIAAKKTGWLDSPEITIAGVAKKEEEPTPPTSSGGGSYIAPINFDVDKGINFLIANQNSDGSIGNSVIYSDWSAIAMSAVGARPEKNKLKEYLQSSGYSTDSAVGVTDLDRRAMALMALGVSPYDGTKIDYIKKISDTFDGQQIGDPTIFNDDIFSLIVLLKAGWKSPEPIINKSLQFIISAQSADGSWGSVDLTSAGIQALSLAKTNGNLDAEQITLVNQSIASAKNWLQQAQASDASFNQNVFSTAWAIQAISALNEPLNNWTKNNQTPLNFLATEQMSDGGLGNQSTDIGTRLWATAYGVPAGLNKSWGSILNDFSKPIPAPQETTLAPIASSTLEIIKATSTENIILDEVKATTTSSKEIIKEKEVPAETAEITVLPQQNLIKAKTGLAVSSASQPKSRRSSAKKLVAPAAATATQVLGDKVAAPLADKTDNPLAAKIIFYVTSGLSIALGAYLGWKFLFKKL